MPRKLRIVLVVLAGIVVALAAAAGAYYGPFAMRVTRFEPTAQTAFHWPYYLYVPEAVKARGGEVTLYVEPNNTGRPDDDLAVHARAAWKRAFRLRHVAEELGTPLLVPVFPRPSRRADVYTHALDRDVLTTDDPALARLDLQLLAMIDDASSRLVAQGYRVSPRVLITGFSASGMFAIRFALLHPERVLAAAAGSPGGWPLAPVAEWQGHMLRYPVGVADLAALTGHAFDAEALRRVPLFFFLGDRDHNDSVAHSDGYDAPDRQLVNQLFGDSPVERWRQAEAIYASMGARARFQLYPGVGHDRTPAMDADVQRFFRDSLTHTTSR